jgi:hypothetical protein
LKLRGPGFNIVAGGIDHMSEFHVSWRLKEDVDVYSDQFQSLTSRVNSFGFMTF